MSYLTATSNYSSPTRRLPRQASAFSLQLPVNSSQYAQESQSLKGKQSLPTFRPPPPSASKKLGSLISKFEALDAVNNYAETKAPVLGQLSYRNSTRFAIGATAVECPPRNLSLIFSPRPPSQGRYENLSSEDEYTVVEKDDVFTCPPYNTIAAIEKSEIGRLKRTSSIITNLSLPKAEVTRKPSARLLVEHLPSTVEVKNDRFKKQSIRDRIKFYGGGANMPSPAAVTQSPKKVNMKVSITRQISTDPATPLKQPKPELRSSKDQQSAKIGTWVSLNIGDTPSTILEDQSRMEEQQSAPGMQSTVAVHTPHSLPKSFAFKAPTSTPRAKVTTPGSAHDSPLRERRLTRSNLHRRTPISRPPSANGSFSLLPQSADRTTSAIRGSQAPHLNTPHFQREDEQRHENQVHERIGELYRAKSQERTNQSSIPLAEDTTPAIPINLKSRNIQLDGAASRRPSKIAGLRARFDNAQPRINVGRHDLPKSLLPLSPSKVNMRKGDTVTSTIAKPSSLLPRINTGLSMIMERTEKSCSESSTDVERSRLVSRHDSKPTIEENHQFDHSGQSLHIDGRNTPIFERQKHLLPPPRAEMATVETAIEMSGGIQDVQSTPQSPAIREHGSPPPFIDEIEPIVPLAFTANTLPIDVLTSLITNRVPTLTINEAQDLHFLRSPSFDNANTNLHIPKKRQGNINSIGIQSARTPFTKALISPVNEIKPLRIPRKRQSLIPQPSPSTKISPEGLPLPLPVSSHRLLMKSHAIEDRIKLFDKSDREVPRTPQLEKLLKDGPYLRSRRKAVAGIKLKSETKSRESVKQDGSIRKELSVDNIKAIVGDFQNVTAAVKDSKKDVRVDGDILSNMIIKEVDCEVVSPRPVRLAEMNRMVVLCRGKGEKVQNSGKL
ncbi:hypothetical protein BJ878DRAFT_545391 [Calycina marina]|uniref:Uncharacterized protein n=1 Tax=Calycina marina TaxID=1763456 RepID=A0A9P7YWI0_9HELO|nr:hypothetical protein BJ878DRAFT_545391 [Calycina marina]